MQVKKQQNQIRNNSLVQNWERSIKKQRYHSADQNTFSQSYGFSVVTYKCEGWTIKKAECQRTGASELWCCRRFESPLDCKAVYCHSVYLTYMQTASGEVLG